MGRGGDGNFQVAALDEKGCGRSKVGVIFLSGWQGGSIGSRKTFIGGKRANRFIAEECLCGK